MRIFNHLPLLSLLLTAVVPEALAYGGKANLRRQTVSERVRRNQYNPRVSSAKQARARVPRPHVSPVYCPEHKYKNNAGHCVDLCTPSSSAYVQAERGGCKCAPTYERYGRQCVPKCLPTETRAGNGECKATCSDGFTVAHNGDCLCDAEGYERVGASECKLECQSGYSRAGNGECKATCSDGFTVAHNGDCSCPDPFEVVKLKGKDECRDKCGLDQTRAETGECACSANFATHRTTGRCSCSAVGYVETTTDTGSKKCVQKCTYTVQMVHMPPATYQNVDGGCNCPEKTFAHESTCVAQCDPKLTNYSQNPSGGCLAKKGVGCSSTLPCEAPFRCRGNIVQGYKCRDN